MAGCGSLVPAVLIYPQSSGQERCREMCLWAGACGAGDGEEGTSKLLHEPRGAESNRGTNPACGTLRTSLHHPRHPPAFNNAGHYPSAEVMSWRAGSIVSGLSMQASHKRVYGGLMFLLLRSVANHSAFQALLLCY